MNIVDLESRPEIKVNQDEKANQHNGPTKIPEHQLEQLEEWAELIRNDIRIEDKKAGWFGKHPRCALGGDIYIWILDHVESNER